MLPFVYLRSMKFSIQRAAVRQRLTSRCSADGPVVLLPQSQYRTSLTLLSKISANNPEAWQRFVKLYAPLVYSWTRNAGVQPADAADIGQEVFRVVATKISQFDPARSASSGFRSWLWGISRLRLLEHFRVHGRQVNGQGGCDAYDQIQRVEQQQDEPQDINGSSPQQLMVQSAIDILRAESEATTWKAFWRMAIDGLSAREVGDELGMTAKAVRQAKFRVTSKLRLLLADGTGQWSRDFDIAS